MFYFFFFLFYFLKNFLFSHFPIFNSIKTMSTKKKLKYLVNVTLESLKLSCQVLNRSNIQRDRRSPRSPRRHSDTMTLHCSFCCRPSAKRSGGRRFHIPLTQNTEFAASSYATELYTLHSRAAELPSLLRQRWCKVSNVHTELYGIVTKAITTFRHILQLDRAHRVTRYRGSSSVS